MKKSLKILGCVLLLCVAGIAGFIYMKTLGVDTKSNYSYTKITDSTSNTDSGYAVSSSSDIATSVGMSVLESGGNAVDAAIAISYTLAVVEPHASGLGGGGGMLVYDTNSGTCIFYDYASCAGSSSTIGIPGFVAGMEALYEDYGTITFSDLLAPAIEYAQNGFTVNETLNYRLQLSQGLLSSYSWLYTEDGTYLETGDTMIQAELAEVLQAIAEEGSDVFYEGWIAEDIAAATSLTLEDLASYEVNKCDPVEGSLEGYTIYSASAPFSGTTLIQMLEMAEVLDIADPEEDILTYLSQLKLITQTAYADRYYNIADPNYVTVDMQELVSEEYILSLLSLEVEDYTDDEESIDTTSFSIVDADGLVVVATNTLNDFWGTKLAVDGIFMNNTMESFSSSGINQFAYGKRPRSFISPTIVVGDDGYILAVGTPGGNKIPCRLLTVLLDILEFGDDPQEAVSRLGVFYRNGVLTIETDADGNTWIDTSDITESIVWRSTGPWWGCISLAGRTAEGEAFSAYDSRRGATMSGTYNP